MTIADWLWMNFLRCFCKSPDLFYTEPSDIGNYPARWVPKQLTDQHKFNPVKAGQEFLRRYKHHEDEFLRSIVIEDEARMHMCGKRFSTYEEVEKWTKGLVGNYFEEGIKNIISRFTTCIEKNGDYVEK